MSTTTRRQCFTVVLLAALVQSNAQDLRSFNQNASRSNHTRMASGFVFRVNGTSERAKADSIAARSVFLPGLSAHYYNKNWGVGAEFGSFNSTTHFDLAAYTKQINGFTLTDVNSTEWKTWFLLAGPSFQKGFAGNSFIISADVLGGIIKMKPASFSVKDISSGATIADYYRVRKENTGAENPLLGIKPNLRLEWFPEGGNIGFNIHANYLRAFGAKEITIYNRDLSNVKFDGLSQQEIRAQVLNAPVVETHTKGPVSNYGFGAGISIRLSSPRDAASGLATGKRRAGKTRYNNISMLNRDAQSGMATGKRILPSDANRPIITPRDATSGLPTGRRMSAPATDLSASCGPVTQKITNPDGSTEEKTFACPEDAAKYNERMSMNATMPKQTQGQTFGEKVNAGLQSGAGALAQGASRVGVISGKVNWNSSISSSSGIITNQQAVSSVGTLGGKGGGASSASYAATGRMMNTTPGSQGVLTNIYAREAGSGMATGKRSRDAGSVMATGRRQYSPAFIENSNDSCTNCAVTVKLIAHELTHTVQQNAVNNPLYESSGNTGSNPMFENKMSGNGNGGGLCGTTTHFFVILTNTDNGGIVAETKTDDCGNFWFANVPEGNYAVRVKGTVPVQKNYDVTVKEEGKYDVAGEMLLGNEQWSIQLNSSLNNEAVQKAGISTSRSNVRTRNITIVEGDTNNDGSYESLRVVGTFSDGTSEDITATSKKLNQTIKIENGGMQMRRRVEVLKSNRQLSNISITQDGTKLNATATYSDGTSENITESVIVNTNHNNVKQYNFVLEDTDDDGIADGVQKTRTKSNNSNDRTINTDNETGNEQYTIKNLVVATGDADNDGNTDVLVGNSFIAGGIMPGGSVVSAAVSSVAMPGTPIGGIIVKGGKNPGGSFRTTQTNENGEFEFSNLKKGNYTISTSMQFYIDDETTITVGDASLRKGWDGTVKGGSIEEQSIRKGWDGTVKGGSIEEQSLRKGWDGTVKGGSVTEEQNAAMRMDQKIKTKSNIKNDRVIQPGEQDDNTAAQRGKLKGKVIKTGDNGMLNKIAPGEPVTFSWSPVSSKTKETTTYKLRVWQLMQGQNATQAMRSNQPHIEKIITGETALTVDNILTGPCKPPYLCDFVWAVQALSATGVTTGNAQSGSFGVDNTAYYVNTTKSNTKDYIIALDELDEILDADKTNTADVISKAKQNSRTLRSSLQELDKSIDNSAGIAGKMSAADTNFAILLGSVNKLGDRYSTISNVLKTKHDTAKNSVGNIR